MGTVYIDIVRGESYDSGILAYETDEGIETRGYLLGGGLSVRNFEWLYQKALQLYPGAEYVAREGSAPIYPRGLKVEKFQWENFGEIMKGVNASIDDFKERVERADLETLKRLLEGYPQAGSYLRNFIRKKQQEAQESRILFQPVYKETEVRQKETLKKETPKSPPRQVQSFPQLSKTRYRIREIPVASYVDPTLEDEATAEDVINATRDAQKLEQIRKSLLELNQWKLRRYTITQNNLTIQRQTIEDKAKRMGVDLTTRDARSIFPEYPGMESALYSLDTIRQKIETEIQLYSRKDSLPKIGERLRMVVTDEKNGIASLKGDARAEIRKIILNQLYSLTRGPGVFIDTFQNFLIMGPPGVGKTFLAKVIAFCFANCGVMATSNVIVATRADLVGQYVGDTAVKTRSQLFNSLEGILIIDEAYQLVDPRQRDPYGAEAITEIVNFIDKYIGLSRIYPVGYEKEIKTQFLASNPGLPRRFPYQVVLVNYSSEDLFEILIGFLAGRVQLNDEDADLIYELIDILSDQGILNNQAGDMLTVSGFLVLKATSGRTGWNSTELPNSEKIVSAFNMLLESKQISFRLSL